MKKLIIPLILTTGLLYSCAKSSQTNTTTTKPAPPPTTADTLIGTWKSVQAATDSNHNGRIDASELTVKTDIIYAFNADSTGYDVNGPHSQWQTDYTWLLEENRDVHLRLYSSGVVIDTVHLYELSQTTMTLGIMVHNKVVYWAKMLKQ